MIVRLARHALHEARCRLDGLRRPWPDADISVFHQFAPPPNGGGNQFLRALMRVIAARGWRVENNTISRTTRACLFNSFNFDATALAACRRPGCRMVHRIDGPIGLYRGWDDGTDRWIAAANRRFADASILQSEFSAASHAELGYAYADPTVIVNAADPELFHPRGRAPWDPARPMRIVSTSWSDNANKGAAVYQWLDAHLDPTRFHYTFAGRIAVPLRNIRTEPPAVTERIAELLRGADLFITASRNDPCSNSVIEALSCGLPVLYLRSGGHPELVGEGGFGFDHPEEIPGLIDRVRADYAGLVARICAPALEDVADRYLAVLGLPPWPEGAR